MSKSTVFPSLRYQDTPGAIKWLCQAFGFETHAVYAAPDGSIMHAQLILGNDMIILGSVSENEYGKLIKQPDEIKFANTQSSYLMVPDADAVYASAKAAGALFLMEIKDQDYGGRGFGCRDSEEHVWSIGTYDPWKD